MYTVYIIHSVCDRKKWTLFYVNTNVVSLPVTIELKDDKRPHRSPNIIIIIFVYEAIQQLCSKPFFFILTNVFIKNLIKIITKYNQG